MKRLAGLVMAAALAVPVVVSAQGEAATMVREGDSFRVWWGHQDSARITILDVRVSRMAAGLPTAPAGRRWYLLRVRYRWLKGQPVSGQWDWYPSGGRFRVSRTGSRTPLPVRVVSRARTSTGWLAWQGPADRSGVRIRMIVDRRSWSLRP